MTTIKAYRVDFTDQEIDATYLLGGVMDDFTKRPTIVFAETASVKGNPDWPFWLVACNRGLNRTAECLDILKINRCAGQTLCTKDEAFYLAEKFNRHIGLVK